MQARPTESTHMTDLTSPHDQWLARPDDFKVLERIPFTQHTAQWPLQLFEPVGDEVEMVILDTETTGLLAKDDDIIELGLVKLLYSKSLNRITAITEVVSVYEDPMRPIPEFVTRLTGISDEMVAGQRIDDAWLSAWLSNKPLIVAHNAQFDRPFFELRFPSLSELYWACSFKGIDWSGLGFESRKLKYLLQDSGWFYEGHRASIDCLAVAWLLYTVPDALSQLLTTARQTSVIVRAIGAPFDAKDALKSRGYRWDGGDKGHPKHWWREISSQELADEKAFLASIYPQFEQQTVFENQTARNRFKMV